VIRLPTAAPEPTNPDLRLVGGTTSSPVIVLPSVSQSPPEPEPEAISAEQLSALVREHGYGGSLLRAARELQGSSLQELADVTRISARYLEALESNNYSSLPSATFVRGYVREMARQLGLDEEAVTAGFMERFNG